MPIIGISQKETNADIFHCITEYKISSSPIINLAERRNDSNFTRNVA